MVVYNTHEPENTQDSRCCVMYLAEFAQDLLYCLIGRDYYFRAILTKGPFFHCRFENLEAFFGQALIDSYRDEKGLIGCGLFMDRRLLGENQTFPTKPYSARYHYVFLTQHIERASEYGQAGFPFSGELLDSTGMTCGTYAQLRFLADAYHRSLDHPDPRVRGKFQATWTLYQLQFGSLCDALRTSGFDPNAIADADWDDARQRFDNEQQSQCYRYNANTPLDGATDAQQLDRGKV